jgi:hypothetical protein
MSFKPHQRHNSPPEGTRLWQGSGKAIMIGSKDNPLFQASLPFTSPLFSSLLLIAFSPRIILILSHLQVFPLTMSAYTDSVSDTRRRSARYSDYPARRGTDLGPDSRLEVYEKQPLLLHRHPDRDREHAGALVVRSKPVLVRATSSDDEDERRPRRKSVVLRPRSTSRVRIQEPVLIADYSSSDDESRRSRRSRRSHGDDTRIRATSRPGKKTEFALVRTPSKKRRKSVTRPVVVTDLELKTGRRHKDFQSRRNDLENTEALVLVRARSQEKTEITLH